MNKAFRAYVTRTRFNLSLGDAEATRGLDAGWCAAVADAAEEIRTVPTEPIRLIPTEERP